MSMATKRTASSLPMITKHKIKSSGYTLPTYAMPTDSRHNRFQNHVPEGPKTRRSYQHHEYLDEMREAWITLGSHLEKCLGRIPNGST